MLSLKRHKKEKIIIGHLGQIMSFFIEHTRRDGCSTIVFDAPKEFNIVREEIYIPRPEEIKEAS